MIESHRDWPPPRKAEPDHQPMPIAVAVALLLFLVAPLAAWLVAALPGERATTWAIWPAGWIASVVVLVAGDYLRGRRP